MEKYYVVWHYYGEDGEFDSAIFDIDGRVTPEILEKLIMDKIKDNKGIYNDFIVISWQSLN